MIESTEKICDDGEKKSNVSTTLWIKTISLIIVWVAFGMSKVLTPTTLPDITKRLGVDTEEISRALAIGGIGGIIGAPLGSISDRYSNKVDAILSGCLFVCAFCIGVRCLSTSLTVFTFNIFFDTMSWSCVNAVGNAMIMDMWGDKGGTPMHALHFGFPLGAMIGPLIAYPFVSTESENVSSSINETATETSSSTESPGCKYNDCSQIEVAFGIVAIFLAIIALSFAVYQIVIPTSKIGSSHNKGGYNWKDVFSPSKWAGGDAKFGVTITLFLMGFFALHIITIKSSSTYYVQFAVEQIGYTNQEGALYSSIANFAGMMGRAVSIICAKCIPIQIMFITEVHGQAISAILTLIWGLDEKIPFLVFSCFFYFFRDPIWPSAYTWTDQYIALYAIVVGLSDMASKCADVIFSWLLGYLYTYTVPESLFYNTVVAGILLCVFVIIMNIVGEKHGRRFKNNQNPNLTDVSKVNPNLNGFEMINTNTEEIMVNNTDIAESTKL